MGIRLMVRGWLNCIFSVLCVKSFSFLKLLQYHTIVYLELREKFVASPEVYCTVDVLLKSHCTVIHFQKCRCEALSKCHIQYFKPT